MKYVIDIETDSLTNVKNIWVVVVKCIETNEYQYFRNILKKENKDELERLSRFIRQLDVRSDLLIGHNLLGYDWPILISALELHSEVLPTVCFDTLIVSKLVDYSRDGHSIEDYGVEFGFEKIKHEDFSKYSPEMEEYCVRDVDICHRIYSKYAKYVNNEGHHASIRLEHAFQLVVNDLHHNGFSFNSDKAVKLLDKVQSELNDLDRSILEAFPPKLKLIREITPKETKYGTLNRSDFRFLGSTGDLSEFNGGPFCRCSWESFNPSSHKQIISVLCDAGWSPVDKTTSHVSTERLVNQLKYKRGNGLDKAREEAYTHLQELRKTGWKVSEPNLETLPDTEPLILWKDKCRLKLPKDQENIRQIIIKEMLNGSEPTRWPLTIKTQELQRINSLSGIMGSALKILKECNPNKTDVAKFVESQKLSWSIIVTSQDVFVDCSASFATDIWAGMRDLQSLQITISQIQAARLLAKRILLESRRRTLTEWLGLSRADGITHRIHGKFYGIGAWTHRMAHQNPNTANIPNEYDTAGKKKLLGKELRSLWCAPKNRLLVGCDAEGIQLRIFAHLINEPEFTEALVKGTKDAKTDPHSLNQGILGDVCRTRDAAKRFIYALLLGAGLGKLAEILGCSESEAKAALDRLLSRYTGWATLKEEVFPRDAKRGWFIGLDGRKVRIPSDTEGGRRHLAMSGYLQNGEAVCMKLATLKWVDKLKNYDAKLVNFVHDEWQVECPNNVQTAISIGQMMADSLVQVGNDLKLNCPLAGSFWNDKAKDYTIGTNWSVTH